MVSGARNVASAQTKTATSTTIVVTSGGVAVTTAAAGSVITLTATVKAGSTALTTGQVNFCDAAAKYCTDIHLLGTAQLANTGTAVVRFRLGIGSHSYKAVFLGTNSDAGSASAASGLTVTGTPGPFVTTTAIAESGSWGNYKLTATVTEVGGTATPSGIVSFRDTSNANAVLGTGALGTGTPGLGWLNSQSSLPNTTIRAIATTDFNGDGIPDLALVNEAGTVVIVLGKGDGTFTTVTASPATGTYPSAIAAGDFNSDGIPDLAVVNNSSNSVTILLGKGDGTFTATASSPATAQFPNDIAVGDFNGDGIADLAVTTGSGLSGGLTVLLGNGDGTFTAAAQSPTGGNELERIVAGDFNGDGKTDLAVSANNSIGILLGNGDGTFTSGANLQIAANPTSIDTGDFNEDGKMDLVVTGTTGEAVTVLLGNGDGTFTAAPAFPAPYGTSPIAVVVADLNEDGIADVAIYDNYKRNGVIVFLGNGDGTFSLSSSQPPPTPSPILIAGDFNGDGWPDLATASQSIVVLLTEPTETATATANVSLPVAGQHMVNASYGGDSQYKPSVSGKIPLWGVPQTTSTTLTLTAGGVSVTTIAPGTPVILTATVKAGATAVTAGQVNFCDASANYCTDMHLLATVALTNGGTAAFKFVPGPGAHSYRAMFVQDGYGSSSSSNVANLTVGPAPNPKYSDTVSITDTGFSGNYTLIGTVTGYGGPAAPTGTMSFLDTTFGNTNLGTTSLGASKAGLGWLISPTPTIGSSPTAEVTGDFNGDGAPDLVVLWTDNIYGGPFSITSLLGNGDGTFKAGPTAQVGLGNALDLYMIAGDFNGDGKTDIAILSWQIGLSVSNVTVLLGEGDGSFAAPQTSVAFNQGAVGGDGVSGSMVAADFNGDGKMDLAVVGDDVTSGEVSILLGNGDGTFASTAINLGSSHSLGLVATGDFNGDNIPDLVVVDLFSPAGATVLLGKGDGTFTVAASLPADTFAKSVVVGDFNGDNKLDLGFGYTNAVEVYLGNGDGTFKSAAANPISGSGLSLVGGDFNHDGKLDLAGIDNYDLQIDLFLGGGDGTFTETVTTPNVSQNFLAPFQLVAADFNEDGVPDLAMLSNDAINSNNINTAAILLTEPTQTATASVTGIAPIGAGTHDVEVSYSGDSNYRPGVSSAVALTAGMAPIAISPSSGVYSSVQTVTITESVPGATIYYEAFGPISTNGFVPYKGPISLNLGGAETIVAYAAETGYQSSDRIIARYTLNLPVAPTPVILPAGSSFESGQTVTITDNAPGATIYYTTNGSYPTLNSTIYKGPVNVSTSETIAAIASAGGYSTSNPASAQYIINSSSSSFIYSVAGNGSSGYSGDGGPATVADLNGPMASVVDKSGNLYIADTNNNIVRKVAAGTGVITTYAGNTIAGHSGDGGPATKAELNAPTGLALDSAGNLYVADFYNSRIRKVTAGTGIITTYAGTGTYGNSGDGGPATSASLSEPEGLAIDRFDNLYIADPGSVTIRKITATTGAIATVAGDGSYGYSGDGGPASSASFRGPGSVAVDRSGNLFIADRWNNVIREVIASTGNISTVAGNGNGAGTNNGGYTGDGGQAVNAELYFPEAVAVDGEGNLYIADTFNLVIRKVAAGNRTISTVAGNGPQAPCVSFGGDGGPAASAALCYPSGITTDSVGNLYIADSGNGRIREVTLPAVPPTAMTASPMFSISPGTYANPQTVTLSDNTPGAAIYVTLDGSVPSTLSQGYRGPLTVTGTITIKATAVAPGYLPSTPVDATYTVTAPPTAVITTVAGNGGHGFAGAGGPAISAQIGSPYGIAFDKAGNFYFSDPQNSVVWKVSAKSGALSVIAGNGTAGYSGNGGPATSAQLWSPQGIAVDKTGNIYIADSSNNVLRKVAADTGLIVNFAGNGQGGNPQAIGDGGPATSAELNYPVALAFDKSGNLYIADEYDSRVRMVSANTGIITTVAGNGSYGFGGDGGPATSASISVPNALAFDTAGNLYIATQNDGRIRKVTVDTGIITTIAGNGIDGISGDGSPATNAEISANGLAVDDAGNLYLSDRTSVREVVASTGMITRVAGNGYYGYSGDGGSATVAGLAGPVGISFDAAGDLFIADKGNSRIRKLTFSAVVATPFLSPGSGTYSGMQTVTITDATPGATIYYTTDGSTPTTASALYKTAIAIAATETIKAIAVADGYVDSAIASATYTITLPAAATPVFSPGAGTYTSTQTVAIADATSGATVYYTTDGTTPTPGSIVYTGPISISQTETLKAVAVANGYSQSAVATAAYTIHSLTTPVMTITPSSTHITTAQGLALMISVSGTGETPIPAGNISLKTGSYRTQQALASGSASFLLAAGTLPVGNDTLTATYTPNSSSASIYSTTTQTSSVTVTAPGAGVATISVTPSAQTITDEQSASVSVSVSGGSGQPIPTGSLTLSNSTFNVMQAIAGGTVSFTIPAGTLSAGDNNLSISYSGDATYGSASGTTVVTISPIVIAVQAPPPVAPGGSSTATVTLSAGSNYAGTMNLTCKLTASPSGAQSLPGCSLNPASVTITSGQSGTSTLMIQTTGTSGSALLERTIRWLGSGGSALATVLLLGIPARRRRWIALFALLLMIGTAGAIGCGGGGSSQTTTSSGPPPTTAGSYTFTVTGTDASANVSTSKTVTVAVQ